MESPGGTAMKTGFSIDQSETFDNLPGAPIVEAVIHFRARSIDAINPEELLRNLTDRLPDYPHHQAQHQLELGTEFGPGNASVRHQQSWHGYRFESAEKNQIAQFTRNGFVFSRLKPYERWENFEAEAFRLWQMYCELVKPPEVQRLGVRFINAINLTRIADLKDVLRSPPAPPHDMALPLVEFMHQTRFDIPNYGYYLNVIQTIKPPPPAQPGHTELLLDLDVFTKKTPAITDETLKYRLAEMRWIKNKAFFSFLTTAAIEQCKE